MGKKKNGKEQKSIRDVLAMVIEDAKRQQPPIQDILQRGKAAIALIDAWSKHRVVHRLGAIVDGMRHLCTSTAWEPFVASISSLKFERSQVDRLERVVTKLARYRDVSAYLYRTARRYPIARNVRVVAVDLPSALFGKSPPNGHVAELIPVLENIYGNTWTLADVCRVLNISKSKAVSLFKKTTSSVKENSGIHAEIQLLAYCNLELTGSKPRVICSSKKACFLCNLLIKTHGKVYTPYSHGRLYTGWRLPKLQDTHLARRLNIAMRDFSRQSLETMRRENRTIKYPHPDESAVHTLVLSSTTLDEPTSGQQDEGDPSKGLGSVDEKELCVPSSDGTTDISASETVLPLEAPADRGRPVTLPPAPGDSGNPQYVQRNEEQYATCGPGTPGGSHYHITPHELMSQYADGLRVPVRPIGSKGPKPPPNPRKVSAEPGNSSHYLSPGERKSEHLSVGHGNSHLFSTNTFDLLVDRNTSCTSRNSTNRLICDVTLLTAEEANRVRNEDSSVVVEVESLDQVSFPLDKFVGLPFFLSGGGSVLQVSLRDDGKVE